MARFKLTPLARSDLQEIRDFIAVDHSQAATHYLRILKEKCQPLANVPGLGVQREERCLNHGLNGWKDDTDDRLRGI
mgnify:CR=1 FL=1